MSFTRGNRVRETNALYIAPLHNLETGWCVNQHKSNSGLLRAAAYIVLVADYPLGIYCKGCTDEIWKTWNAIIGEEAHKGVVRKRGPHHQSQSTRDRIAREETQLVA